MKQAGVTKDDFNMIERLYLVLYVSYKFELNQIIVLLLYIAFEKNFFLQEYGAILKD